jgi:hypothetical protein
MNGSTAERIANIGVGERRKRLLFGIVALIVGMVIMPAPSASSSPATRRECDWHRAVSAIWTKARNRSPTLRNSGRCGVRHVSSMSKPL